MSTFKGKKLGFKDLSGLLAKKPVARYWALCGPDEDLKDEARQRIANALSHHHGEGFERVFADAADHDLDAISVQYLVGSLFSKAKLVDLKNIDSQPAAARKAFLKNLASSEQHPSIHLILSTQDREESLPDIFTKIAFWPFRTTDELNYWIRETCKRLKLEIDPQVPRALHDLFGFDTSAIRQELVKAQLYASGRLTVDDLAAHATEHESSDVFLLLTDFLSARVDRLLPGLAVLWEQGEPPQRFLAMLIAQMRRVLTACALTAENPYALQPVFDLAEEHAECGNFWRQKTLEKSIVPLVKASLPEDAFDEFFAEMKPLPLLSTFQSARHYDAEKARLAYRELLELDWAIKTSRAEPEAGLEQVALEIARIVR